MTGHLSDKRSGDVSASWRRCARFVIENEKFAFHEFRRLSCNIKLQRKSASRQSELSVCETTSTVRQGSATTAWYWWIIFVLEYMKYISSRCMGIEQLLSTETNSKDRNWMYDFVKSQFQIGRNWLWKEYDHDLGEKKNLLNWFCTPMWNSSWRFRWRRQNLWYPNHSCSFDVSDFRLNYIKWITPS